MAGSKNHTDVCTTNIIKPALEALSADDRMRHEEEEMMRQLAERRKEEEEMMRQLAERCKKAEEEYILYFAVDRHQKIIRQGEIDMESLLPRLRLPL
jgi:aspartate/methionine/tyrosine aminotransferase